ncbi:substrate-binding periplasmic protein [Fluviispira sanaruensis]|uniref:Amino acid ABC transporter substrate-binding protein n=1 Tax=Fluviispira sanaruensis TaxID=2493639 RepID=A0A4P2VQZ4_FLUSA|nr:transporter substrate-binding domain-containing protein [Fluviispira sanaruensis]BBH54569.1 amino acid ABC transporter substrate-binding protein [Fluviispira sanaruensis]
MRNFIFYCIIFLISWVYKSEIFAINNKEKDLRICLSGGYVPYKIKKINGTWEGFDVDIVKDFAKYLNANPKFIDVEWASILPSLLAFKCDMIAVGLVITPEREKIVSFADVVYKNDLALAILNSEENIKKYKCLDDLVKEKKVISVAIGTSSSLYASKNNLNVKTYKSFDAPIDSLLTKKSDAVLFEKHYLNALPKHVAEKIYIIPTLVHQESVSAAFRPEDVALKNQFNKFLKSWLRTDKLSIYEKKYFSN